MQKTFENAICIQTTTKGWGGGGRGQWSAAMNNMIVTETQDANEQRRS